MPRLILIILLHGCVRLMMASSIPETGTAISRAGDVSTGVYQESLIRALLQTSPDSAREGARLMLRQALLSRSLEMEGIAHVLLGKSERIRGVYLRSLGHLYIGLDKLSETGSVRGLADVNEQLGMVYLEQCDTARALHFIRRAHHHWLLAGDRNGLAENLFLQGFISLRNDPAGAERMFREAFELNRSIGNLAGKGKCLGGMGLICIVRRDLGRAMGLLERAEALLRSSRDLASLAAFLRWAGQALMDAGRTSQAMEWCRESEVISSRHHFAETELQACKCLYEGYKHHADSRRSLRYLEHYAALYQALHGDAIKGRFIHEELSRHHEQEKDAIVTRNLAVVNQLSEHGKKQRTAMLASFLVILIVSAFSLFTFKRSLLLRRQNRIIEHQRELVETKRAEIIDSLRYAQHIQNALLRNEKKKTSVLPPHFIIYRPKEIISGDFYWMMEKKGYLYMAASDCTGHGAPGAFLTLLGNSFLNEINSGEDLLSPAEILEVLRKKFIHKLGQSSGGMEGHDGMDISLMRVNLTHLEMEWAGANLPAYVIRRSPDNESYTELIELKGDKQPVGYHPRQTAFTNHRFDLRHGDRIYLPTDGFSSQFGGPLGKKFKSSQLKQMLLAFAEHTMEEQKALLSYAFDEWRGDEEQVDDVCLIGFEVVQFAAQLKWHLEAEEPSRIPIRMESAA